MGSHGEHGKQGLTRRHLLGGSALAGLMLRGGGIAMAAPSPLAEPSPDVTAKKATLLACLGGPWPDPCELKPILRETTPKDGYRLESVTYEAEPGERVPAYVLIPDGVSAASPAPAIAVWHQHNLAFHLGKTEPAGLGGMPMHQTGVALAKLGYVVVCPDALCFGERQDSILKDMDYERFEYLRYVVAGKCMAWKNILDMRRAIDYLCTRPEVNADRIGCYGHSMGSSHTWMLGPWEPRLKCLVGNCCLPTYAGIHRTHILSSYVNFVPGWFAHGDTPDIAALTAPRRLHLNLGETDAGSPIEEAREGLKRIAAAYEAAGAPDNFTSFVEPGTGHVLSEAMWKHVKDVFETTLRS